MADPGSLLFQGLANAGNEYAQGVQNYQQYQQADAAATGQVNAFLAQGPGAMQSLSPDGQALIQKQLDGNANRKDRLQLLGEITTAQTLKQQKADLAAKQANTAATAQATAQAQAVAPYVAPSAAANLAAAQQEAALGGIRVTQAQAQQRYLDSLANSGTQAPVAPAGPGQPAPAGPTDNIQNFTRAYAQATHTLPPAEVIAKYIQQQATVEQPIGVVSGGTISDPKNGTMDQYYRVYKNGMGTTRVDTTPINVAYNTKAPGTLLDSETFQPARVALINKTRSPNPVASAQTGTTSTPDVPDDAQVRIKTPEQQVAIKSANDDLQNAMDNLTMTQTQDQAAQKYAAASPVKGALNSWLGSPAGLKLRQLTGDNTGKALLKANAAAMGPLVKSMAGTGRILTPELTQMQQSQGLPTDDNQTLTDATDMAVQHAQALVARQQAVKNRLVQGWAPGDAVTKAVTDSPFPKFVQKSVRTAQEQAAAAPKKPAAGAGTPAGAPVTPQAVPVVSTPQDYAGLPSGAVYKTPKGTFKTKP